MPTDGSLDDTIETFVELEDELGAAGEYDAGTVAGAAKVAAGDVPDDYPVTVDAEHGLRLDVEVAGGGTVATYLEWPEAGRESSDVADLLDALGHGVDEFASLYGDEVALDSRDGWHVIDVAATRERHDDPADAGGVGFETDAELDAAERVLLAGVAAGAVGFLLANTVLDGLSSVLRFASWVVIPAVVFYDVRRVRERLDWDTEPGYWVAGALVPVFGVAVGVAYLVDRRVRMAGVGEGDVSKAWFGVVVASALVSVVSLAVFDVAEDLSATLFAYAWLLMPIAVYFDAEYVEDATDWQPNKGLWAVGVFLTWVVGAGAYLFGRSRALD